MTDDIASLAAGLTSLRRYVLENSPDDWFAASDLVARPGNTLSVLAEKGYFEQRSDPEKWGRSQYRITAAGRGIRGHLETARGRS